jgi:hypothetical protein
MDLFGDAKTVVKANYGTFWFYPSVNFGNGVNPNPSGWNVRYPWTDTNRNGFWDAGEENRGVVLSRRGGSAATAMDRELTLGQRADWLPGDAGWPVKRRGPAVKAAAAKMRPRKRRKMSAAHRASISAAQRARWARQKADAVPSDANSRKVGKKR